MKLREIFGFEFAYQARRVSTWIYFTLLFLLTAYVTREVSTEFLSSERFFFHSPVIVAIVTVYGTLTGLLIAAGFAGDAATRDVQTLMDPLLCSTPVSTHTHLAGRFLATFSLHGLILLALPLGLLLAGIVPPKEPGLVGPFRPVVYLSSVAFILLPNCFIASALLFSLAALTRRAMSSYAGALIIAAASVFSWLYIAQVRGQWQLAQLLDPSAGTVLGELAMRWTAAERSTLLVGLQPSLLLNRALWTCVAFAMLAMTHSRYRLSHHAPGSSRRDSPGHADRDEAAPIIAPRVRRSFRFATHARQTLEIARQSYRQTMAGWGAVAISAICALAVATGMDNDFMGVPLVATAGSIAAVLSEAWWSMIVALLISFFAGELIWRERESRLSEITDACPTPEWASILGRFVGLVLYLVTLQSVMMCSGILIQVLANQYDLHLALYGQILFGLQLVDFLLLGVLAFAIHAVVNHKYVGHFVFSIAYLVMTARRALGIENNLLVYGSDPGWAFSDMRGFEPYLEPWLWFKLYWLAWALLLALLTLLTWVRGKDTSFATRLALARGRLRRPAVRFGTASLALIAGAGGFILYNTHVLNTYDTGADITLRRADYERKYSQYAGIAQPQLTNTTLAIEVNPEQREVEMRGTYGLLNAGTKPIDTVHVSTSSAVETTALRFDRPARNVVSDDRLGHQIYTLDPPLQPGESLRLEFKVQFKPRGFTNRALDPSVVADSAYFTNLAWLPTIGYQSDRELQSPGERRSYGLPARPALHAPDAEGVGRNPERSARLAFEATIGTDARHVAVAPGRLRRTWPENGRRYFQYATDAPIRNDYAIYSAPYAVRAARWRPPSGAGPEVSIEVFHHPHHTWNVDRMLRSVQASLDYYTKMLGPYLHGQVRLVEHPGDSVVLHAAPVNVSYDERFSMLNPDEDARGLDLPFAVVAHEMAHQWWGNTVTAARAEGAALLSEGLAWYSAIGVVEQALGHDHLVRLLRMMREVYLIPDTRANVPLLRASDRFLAYRKGPFAMYALREYVGREPIDTALRRFFEQHSVGTLPLPTSLDLYRELQAMTPQAFRPLLADLFERNTWWELATDTATARQITGAWQVTLNVRARKVVVDEDGGETELPMDDPVEIGVFAGNADEVPGDVLYLQKHRIRSGEQRIVVTVPRQPVRAGIDPRRLLIDVDGDDNVKPTRR